MNLLVTGHFIRIAVAAHRFVVSHSALYSAKELFRCLTACGGSHLVVVVSVVACGDHAHNMTPTRGVILLHTRKLPAAVYESC